MSNKSFFCDKCGDYMFDEYECYCGLYEVDGNDNNFEDIEEVYAKSFEDAAEKWAEKYNDHFHYVDELTVKIRRGRKVKTLTVTSEKCTKYNVS